MGWRCGLRNHNTEVLPVTDTGQAGKVKREDHGSALKLFQLSEFQLTVLPEKSQPGRTRN